MTESDSPNAQHLDENDGIWTGRIYYTAMTKLSGTKLIRTVLKTEGKIGSRLALSAKMHDPNLISIVQAIETHKVDYVVIGARLTH